MPTVKKFTDWGNYWIGLRTNLFKCIGTAGSSWLGSNALASTGIPGTDKIGLDWRQAIGMFAVHIGLEVFTYMKNQQPQVVTETSETVTVTTTETKTEK